MAEYLSTLTLPMMIVYGLAAFLVLALLVIGISRLFRGSAKGRRGDRLSISEYCEVDQTRRLVLVRRDHVEHLVMIGGTQDFVIETGIDTNAELNTFAAPEGMSEKTYVPASPRSKPRSVIPMRPPREPVFGSNRPILHHVESEPEA